MYLCVMEWGRHTRTRTRTHAHTRTHARMWLLVLFRMTADEASERPAVGDCLQHPFFWSLDDVQRVVKEVNDELQGYKRDASNAKAAEAARRSNSARVEHARQLLDPLRLTWESWFGECFCCSIAPLVRVRVCVRAFLTGFSHRLFFSLAFSRWL